VNRLPFLLVGLALAAPVPAAESPTLAPAKNWVLPLFTPEGHRSMLARGSEARFSGVHQIDVTNLNLVIFQADGSGTIETIILSPAATFLPDANIARGEQSMRLIRDDLEATGTRWIYDHANKKVSLDGRVQIVINAQLKDLLK
jgi:hypothetical protein